MFKVKINYIGSFPPPYGGVTIKNKMLVETLGKFVKINVLKSNNGLPKRIAQLLILIRCIFSQQSLIIGISSKGGKSLLLTKLLYKFNRKIMKRSLYFMMGGRECYRIAKSEDEIKWYSNYKGIYVETESMVESLKKVGLTNIFLFPNCRPEIKRKNKSYYKHQFKCVFFSYIEKMKGVDNIIRASELLPQIHFDFWGEISSEYKNHFFSSISHNCNCKYNGCFKGNMDEVYKILEQYDVLLLPTKWKSEGVPGILVEAKIVGLPAIVSNNSYNAEIVKDGVDGFVLKENTPEALVEAIKKIYKNPRLNVKLKKGCKDTAQKYYIENYIPSIVKKIIEK